MVTSGHKRSNRTATPSSLSAHMPRRGHAKLTRITPSSRKIRIPFTDTSSSSEDTQDTPPIRPKRANSDPPEDTEDMFQATKPVFSSFQTKGWDKPKTRQAKRHETILRLSFGMDELMQGEKEHRPSLAVADGHPIPPLLPVRSFFPGSSQSSIPEALSHLTPPTTPPNPEIEAIRATGARISLASDELASMSFYKKTPGKKLVSVPEHSNFGSTGQRPSFRGPGYFQSFGSLPGSGFGSSPAGSTGTPGGTPTNEDVDMPDSQNSGYMPRASRKDQGYGFSYSDFSDNEEAQAVDDWEMTQTPIINTNTSFKDVVVMRDIARNWTFRQPSVLPCTHAKLDDTIRVKNAAMALLSYDESEDIYFSLCNRLERMVRTELDTFKANSTSANKNRKKETSRLTVPLVHSCAVKLREFLKKVGQERAMTGECEQFVQHELQWAEWFEEASRVGVLHLKVAGCRCRPEWEGPESEDGEL